jgi:hypothetical protein
MGLQTTSPMFVAWLLIVTLLLTTVITLNVPTRK